MISPLTIALLLLAQGPGGEALPSTCLAPSCAPGLDGHGPPPLTESSHSFDCGGIRASVRFRQEVARLLPDLSNLDRASQVTLLDLTVGGRRVRSSDLAQGRALLRSFAWIDNVRGVCFGNEMEIWLKSMPQRNGLPTSANGGRTGRPSVSGPFACPVPGSCAFHDRCARPICPLPRCASCCRAARRPCARLDAGCGTGLPRRPHGRPLRRSRAAPDAGALRPAPDRGAS